MPGRLITMQRQARELGRLRTGYTDTSGRKPRPVRSDTWIVTSHAEHYVQAAADAWGGDVEKWQPQGGGAQQWRVRTDSVALDAILPPGDPLSQTYELWSGGGCVRRCDGVTEAQTDAPCICRAQCGDDFHEQPKGSVCSATTRLNVFLPDMPDVGVFRMETHSFYAAQEIAGAVDLIKSAVGPESVIPIRLRIEQRQRKAAGQTKKFPVVVVELRGVTTGQVLAGSVMGAELPTPRERMSIEARPSAPQAPAPRAIESAPAASAPVIVDRDSMSASLDAIAAGGTLDDLREFCAAWSEVQAAGLAEKAMKIADEFEQAAKAQTSSQPTGDVDALWLQIMQTVPEDWPTSKVEEDFLTVIGVAAESADAEQMSRYLTLVKARAS